ncbi:MAG: peptidase T [Succinivibrio sp.]|nr:peptidase T [Succinivibrio sp.]
MYQKGSVKDLENLCGIDQLVKIFCELISYDTTADELSSTVPSTVGQLRLGAFIAARLSALDYDCRQDDKGVVTVKVPASEGYENSRKLCLLSHLDTSPDADGANIKAALVRNYRGEGIELENGQVTDESICPSLASHKGDDIIVTDGTTLLGADDKAGVAVLIKLLHDIRLNPSLVHGPLTVVFSVDEEIGLSVSHLDVSRIDCDFGVTIDGTDVGELDVATFNAAGAVVSFTGRSIHTAVAYKKMVNAIGVATRFMNMLPPLEKPEATLDKEGFYHVYGFEGNVGEATVRMLLRDFTTEGLKARTDKVLSIARMLNDELGYDCVCAQIRHQYSNMADVLKDRDEILKLCRKAYTNTGLAVKECWIRGGTDGSNLSCAGLPCPNIFTGGLCCHGVHECLPVQSLNASYNVVCELVKLVAKGI